MRKGSEEKGRAKTKLVGKKRNEKGRGGEGGVADIRCCRAARPVGRRDSEPTKGQAKGRESLGLLLGDSELFKGES